MKRHDVQGHYEELAAEYDATPLEKRLPTALEGSRPEAAGTGGSSRGVTPLTPAASTARTPGSGGPW